MGDIDRESKFEQFKHFLLGKARTIHDPQLFHKLSLIAFFAWVGLGADGLSSSCYGPEEAFLALKSHMFLGVFVALATVITIFVITASYSQIVELFPSGGGGYLVASKLLSPTLGMISGCALIIDYVLTITLSIASGADALFSFLPSGWHAFKLEFAALGVLVLIVLNLRGVKESVLPLVPIFLLFLATHVFAILYGICTHLSDFSGIAATTAADVHQTSSELGLIGMLLLIMRSYSMGAGTYTGIEAVSNGIPILRDPQVATAKKTMRYMAISLAFMALGLMVGYLLYRVHYCPGKTLNAVLFENMVKGWDPHIAYPFVLITLISEAVLLFVAAQTGFLDGPRVMANMALDRWFPVQFTLLSERLVIKNGIMLMGISALIIMIASRGSVKFLVVLYSINVFITFFLSQLGMVRHWWKVRHATAKWMKRLVVNGLGLVLTAFILVSVVTIKFNEGGWITILITGSLIGVAVFIKRYYYSTRKKLKHLDRLIMAAEIDKNEKVCKAARVVAAPAFDPDSKIAVLLVNGFNGSGLHTLLNVKRLFGAEFKNFFFIQAGMLDAERFKGAAEIGKLEEYVKKELNRFVEFVEHEGFYGQAFSTIGTDIADEIGKLAYSIFELYPQSVFFGGQVVFPEDTIFTRLLYNHTTFAVQRRLHQRGIPFIIMPIRVS